VKNHQRKAVKLQVEVHLLFQLQALKQQLEVRKIQKLLKLQEIHQLAYKNQRNLR